LPGALRLSDRLFFLFWLGLLIRLHRLCLLRVLRLGLLIRLRGLGLLGILRLGSLFRLVLGPGVRLRPALLR
jgi:hypothetical protein